MWLTEFWQIYVVLGNHCHNQDIAQRMHFLLFVIIKRIQFLIFNLLNDFLYYILTHFGQRI